MSSKPKNVKKDDYDNLDDDNDDDNDDNSVADSVSNDGLSGGGRDDADSDDDGEESLGYSEEDENPPDSDNESDAEEVVKGPAKKNARPHASTKPPVQLDNTDIYADILQDDDDDDTDLDAHLRKFDPVAHQELISKHHSELQTISPEEMRALCKVTRDSSGKIVDPLHTTMPRLTKYEKTRVIGVRAAQIEGGGPPFIQLPDSIIQSHTIAEMEFNAKALPFIIGRPLNGSVEYWRLCDLECI